MYIFKVVCGIVFVGTLLCEIVYSEESLTRPYVIERLEREREKWQEEYYRREQLEELRRIRRELEDIEFEERRQNQKTLEVPEPFKAPEWR